MKITADTNLLVRFFTNDDHAQAKAARNELAEAELVAVPLSALCELVWVLRGGYRISGSRIADTIRELATRGNVEINQPAVEAGLAMLDAGGDFGDGVIAHEGRSLGGDVFLSFDKQAVKLLLSLDKPARLLN